jgi:uncharacterized protein
MTDYAINHIVPIGTQVVTQIDIPNAAGEVIFVTGAVGVVVKTPVDPTHAYRVRFMDGTEATLKRGEFAVRKHFTGVQAEQSAQVNLTDYIVYRCVVGSQAFGLDDDTSDTDRRGFFLPPADLQWSLFGVPEQLENDAQQEAYWEVQKFIVLALKANPNVLECLYTPLVELAAPIAQELLAEREMFLSKLIYQTYNGYVMSQFKKMQQHLQNYGEIKWKHAMHLIRLLLSGITALNERVIPVRVEENRDQLLAIRRGEMTWETVNEWRVELHQAFDNAFRRTSLPDRPDYERANDFLLRARRSAL